MPHTSRLISLVSLIALMIPLATPRAYAETEIKVGQQFAFQESKKLGWKYRYEMGKTSIFTLPGVYAGPYYEFALSADSALDSVCRALGKNQSTAADVAYKYNETYIDAPGIITIGPNEKITQIKGTIEGTDRYLAHISCE